MNFFRGLNILSLSPKTGMENDDSFRFLAINSKSGPEWLLFYLGTVRDSIAIVTIFYTLGVPKNLNSKIPPQNFKSCLLKL